MIPFPFQIGGVGMGYRTSAGSGPANVISQLHLDGADLSDVITDVIAGRTWTRTGTASDGRISTAQSKFGGASFYASTATARAISNTDVNDAFGTGDFTIEFWYRPDGSTGTKILFDSRAAAGTVAPCIYVTSNTLRYYTNSADRITGGGLTTATQAHIAVSRVSGTTRLFIEGTQTGSSYTDSNNYVNQVLAIGNVSYGTANTPAQGFIDEVRVTKGVGRYSANFTAPSSPFPDS